MVPSRVKKNHSLPSWTNRFVRYLVRAPGGSLLRFLAMIKGRCHSVEQEQSLADDGAVVEF
jgi:hypothetical protein